MNRYFTKFTLAALFYVGGYSALAPFLFKIHSGLLNGKEAVLLGMSIYAGVQLSGTFVLDLISKSIAYSRGAILTMRLVAVLLAFVPSFYAIISSFLLNAFSYAAYYRLTRVWASKHEKEAYTHLNLGTNLCWLIGPIIGGYLVSLESASFYLIVTSIMFSLGAFFSLPVNIRPKETLVSSALKDDVRTENTSTFLSDALRLFVIVVGINGFFTWVPIYSLHLASVHYSEAFFYGLNSIIIISFQILILKYKIPNLTKAMIDFSCIITFLICLGASIYSSTMPIWVAVGGLILFAVIGARSIPSTESLIFSDRNYTNRQLNTLMVVDGIGSFAGPLLINLHTLLNIGK